MKVLNQQKVDELAGEIGQENVPVLLEIFLGELKGYYEHLDLNVGQILRCIRVFIEI